MGDAGTIIFALVLLGSPIALVAVTVMWRKAIKRARASEAALSELEPLAQAKIEAAQAEARRTVDSIKARFAGVTDLDAEKERVEKEIASLDRHAATLRLEYAEKKAIYDRLKHEVAIFDDRLAFAEMGVYEPHFDFSDSEAYKAAIVEMRDRQKRMISDKTAVICTTNWTVDGSQSMGQTMTNRNVRLTLRAFNNECDAAIANTRWNNAEAMANRILRAQEQIDKLNASNATYMSADFVKLKLQELYLTHEWREKLKVEREEKADALRLAREEQKLLRDMEQAEEQESHYARLLEQAKAEAASIVGPKLDAFSDQIALLEKDLADAQAKLARAQAMAERTRSGYVYIVSNIGSFGEGVVKIGLTRRLDPIDRVRELGDASVPFTFDTHAIIYSDDAPALERALHASFETTRINAQNYRKEFFRTSLDQVEAAVTRLAPEATFFKDIEAQEYRETLSRRRQQLETEAATEAFPAEL